MTRRRSDLRSRSIVAALVVALVAIALVIVITRSSGPRHASHATTGTTSPPPSPVGAPRFFAPDSIWNQPLAAGAPLDPRSAAIVANLVQQQAAEGNGFGTGSPIYTVGANVPTVRVTLDGVNPTTESLQKAWMAVPIPSGAQPSSGSDSYLVVDQPSSNTMWEFWKASHEADGWHAQWGGRMLQVSTNPGYYRNLVSPSGEVLESNQWGAPATSLPVVAGMITVSELRRGSINHAVALLVHDTCKNVWAFPAQRTDGNVKDDPNCVPEGAHFRLDARLDLASLHLPHFVYLVALAAQKYGIIIDDRTAGIGFRVEDPVQLQAQYGYNPYLGPQHHAGTPGALLQAPPSVLVRDFPWSHLQLLPMDLRTKPDKSSSVVSPPPGG